MNKPSSHHPFWVVVRDLHHFHEWACTSESQSRLVLRGFSAELQRVRKLPPYTRVGRFLSDRQSLQRVWMCVVSHRDKLLHMGELLVRCRREQVRQSRLIRRQPVFTHRRGPVPGTAKRRGGPHGGFRQIHTQAERRLNALVVMQDGEVAARPSRSRGLPSAWDDVSRHGDTCWKTQRKGRKAWERRRVQARLHDWPEALQCQNIAHCLNTFF